MSARADVDKLTEHERRRYAEPKDEKSEGFFLFRLRLLAFGCSHLDDAEREELAATIEGDGRRGPGKENRQWSMIPAESLEAPPLASIRAQERPPGLSNQGTPTGTIRRVRGFVRRHLTTGQRAAVAVDALPLFEAEARARQGHGLTGPGLTLPAIAPEAFRGEARQFAAEKTGASARYVGPSWRRKRAGGWRRAAKVVQYRTTLLGARTRTPPSLSGLAAPPSLLRGRGKRGVPFRFRSPWWNECVGCAGSARCGCRSVRRCGYHGSRRASVRPSPFVARSHRGSVEALSIRGFKIRSSRARGCPPERSAAGWCGARLGVAAVASSPCRLRERPRWGDGCGGSRGGGSRGGCAR